MGDEEKPHDLIPYNPVKCSIEAKNLGIEPDETGTEWVVTVTCPKCFAAIEYRTKMTGVATVLASSPTPKVHDREKLVTMVCDCRIAHENRPIADLGCGAYWTIILKS